MHEDILTVLESFCITVMKYQTEALEGRALSQRFPVHHGEENMAWQRLFTPSQTRSREGGLMGRKDKSASCDLLLASPYLLNGKPPHTVPPAGDHVFKT